MNRKQWLLFFNFFVLYFFGMEQSLTTPWCNVLEYVKIQWALWSRSCHWHLLMKPIPIPIPPTQSGPTPCIPMAPSPDQKFSLACCSFPQKLCALSFHNSPGVAPLGSKRIECIGLGVWLLQLWWEQCDHMIALLLSVHIYAFVGLHLYLHDCMTVGITAFNIWKLTMSEGAGMCAYDCLTDCFKGMGVE